MNKPSSPRPPALPDLLERKLYKTGQTRGADDDVIFQNRVLRTSTVLIPFSQWPKYRDVAKDGYFENGYIVLISPDKYFDFADPTKTLKDQDLVLGDNLLLFYETRAQWAAHEPSKRGWKPATSRTSPLQGHYVARIAGTTSAEVGERINRGFTTTSPKGAGIRVYEYAQATVIKSCRLQLEALFWLCKDSIEVATANGMSAEDAQSRKKFALTACDAAGFLDYAKMVEKRLIDDAHKTVCPLCLEQLSASGFFSRMRQAEGREVHDLTVTELNLFHVEELAFGIFNHMPYNLAWGHHHCNVVAKDSGIKQTLDWMCEVIDRNVQAGYLRS